MKNSTVVLISFSVSLAVVALIGLGYLIATLSANQPTGSFTAQDLQEFGDYNKKIGAENLRQALIKANTDTTVKACQVRD
jgi:hypothetical protein